MTAATHVRITNGELEFITWPEARDEMNAVQMRQVKVRTASSTQGGRGMFITYPDGRKVEIRPATDADQLATPVETEQTWAHARTYTGLHHVVGDNRRAACNRGIWLDVRPGFTKTRAELDASHAEYDFVHACPKCLAKLEK